MTDVVKARRGDRLQIGAPGSEGYGQRAHEELLVLRHHTLHKGSHQAFVEASRRGVWPVYEKIGARVVGDFKVVYPPPPAGHMSESHEYDEVLMITRYASYAHWRATRHPAMLLGDGPDVEQFNAALAERRGLTLETDATFLAGDLYHSPPTHVPALAERYRRL